MLEESHVKTTLADLKSALKWTVVHTIDLFTYLLSDQFFPEVLCVLRGLLWLFFKMYLLFFIWLVTFYIIRFFSTRQFLTHPIIRFYSNAMIYFLIRPMIRFYSKSIIYFLIRPIIRFYSESITYFLIRPMIRFYSNAIIHFLIHPIIRFYSKSMIYFLIHPIIRFYS